MLVSSCKDGINFSSIVLFRKQLVLQIHHRHQYLSASNTLRPFRSIAIGYFPQLLHLKPPNPPLVNVDTDLNPRAIGSRNRQLGDSLAGCRISYTAENRGVFSLTLFGFLIIPLRSRTTAPLLTVALYFSGCRRTSFPAVRLHCDTSSMNCEFF